MKFLKKLLITVLIVGVLSIIAGYIINSYVDYGTVVWDSTILFSSYTGICLAVGLGLWAFIQLIKLDPKGSSSVSSSKKKKEKQDEQQYFKGGWLSIKDMKKRFLSCKYSQLRSIDMVSGQYNKMGYFGAGVVVRAELMGQPYRGTDIDLSIVPPTHTLVVGNTRSGKGESFVIPNIQILSELQTKPSFIISDPKGELYDLNAAKLRKRGYDIKVFDLRQPFKSDKWNPLSVIYDTYQEAIHIKKEVYLHRNETPAQCGLKYAKDVDYGDSWFEFKGEAFSTELEMETAVKGTQQVLFGEITSTVRDIASVLIPTDDPKQAVWTNGARDFTCAILLAMLEDSADPELGMTKEKYNLYNFYKIANIKSEDSDDRFATLRDYFENRSAIFGVKELANAVTTSGQTTASSFLSVLTPALGLFADPAICFITSETEIDFSTISTKPTAFFIKVPDEQPVYHKVAGMLIEQLYKELVKQSVKQGGSLKRSAIFMLDEFANLPKFDKMTSYISVGAGRHIFFYIIVQDYSQIAAKYGEQEAKTIKNNCNLKIFVGSNEMATLKEFNELLGKKTVEVTDKSTSTGGKSSDKQTTESKKEQQRDLMFVEELQVLPEDNVVAVMSKCEPMKTICTRRYKCSKVYDFEKTPDEFKPTRFLDTEKLTYSINNYINKNQGMGDSGSDEDWFK